MSLQERLEQAQIKQTTVVQAEISAVGSESRIPEVKSKVNEGAIPSSGSKDDIKRAWSFIYPRLKSVWAKWPSILEHVENIERWLEQ